MDQDSIPIHAAMDFAQTRRLSFVAVLAALALALASGLGPAARAAGATADAPSASVPIHNIRGFLPDLRFTLKGAGDKTVTQEAFKGKTVLLFFGFTNCPDVCPTTMAQLSQVMANLGDDAQKVRILFISVDPHRDTAEKTQAFVEVFNKNAVGLTGTEEQIADVARRYRVAYQIKKPANPRDNNYEVAHSRGVYVFDEKGRARLLAADTESVKALTDSVRPLLAQAAQ